MLIFSFVLLFSACSQEATGPVESSESASQPSTFTSEPALGENTPLFDQSMGTVEKISISHLDEYGSATELFTVDDPEEIQDLIAMFDGWYLDAHVADSAIDGPPNYKIRFAHQVTIFYFYPGQGLDYRCLIDNKYYNLPEAFGQYLDQAIQQYE